MTEVAAVIEEDVLAEAAGQHLGLVGSLDVGEELAVRSEDLRG